MKTSAARQTFEVAIRGRSFRVDEQPGGARRVVFIGEHTSRNTETEALGALEDLAHKAGLKVGIDRERRGLSLWINRDEPPPQDEILNDLDHPCGCDCPACLPEKYDPAEREAGLGEKACGAGEGKECSVETAPSRG